MSLVKEETELGLGLVAHFRQPLEQLGEQPQEKSRIEARIAHQFIRGQNVDVSSPILIGPNEILERDRGLAEELVAALILQDEELALAGADGGLGYIAVTRGQLGGVVRDIAEHGAKILEIEHQEPLLVRNPEADVQDAFLNLIEIHQAREQQRSHFGDGGTDGVTLVTEQIPEHHWELVRLISKAEALCAADESLLGLALLRDAGEIPLDVCGKDRNAGSRQSLCQDLQGYGFAGARSACHQSMPICQSKRQNFRF